MRHSTRPGAPTLTVAGVLDGRWTGALAYALDLGLNRPGLVRLVRGADEREPRLGPPVRVVTEPGSTVDALVRAGEIAEVVVVEADDPAASAAVHELATRLTCLLVVVDGSGRVVRTSAEDARRSA